MFTAAYDKVKDRDSYMSMLGTLLPQWESETDALRNSIRDTPGVHAELVRLANDDARWVRAVASSRSHRAARSSLPAAVAIAESAVRIIRPATQAQLDALPRIDKDDPDSGPHPDALLKCRLVSAFVLQQQLEHFGTNVYPHIYMSNAAPLFMVGRDTVREWFQWATDARFLHQSQAPAARMPGRWNVRKLDEHDAPLTPEESLLAEALVAGDMSHPAALLLLNSTHAAWSQKKRSMKGFRDWWAALCVAANRPTSEVSKSDERRAAQLNIRTLDDIEALVTPEGRARYDARQAQRAEEREASNAWFASIGEKNTDAWTIIRERLDWSECTEETLLDWTREALTRLSAANERAWASGDGPRADARAVAVRDSLTWRIREKFKLAPDLAAALRALHVSALTRAERNLRDVLGWGTVSADQLIDKAQETVLRLVSAPDDLAADIRRTLIDAIPRRYPHDASAVAEALTILKGAA
ncbi:hypothetical protein AS96_12985 [Microbacterium sp. MRS-1]|nr:hypothetical protein AS96_12985 [Microbacterium sp. MRS-1]